MIPAFAHVASHLTGVLPAARAVVALVAAGLAWWSWPAAAQQVYRCGNAYVHAPCPQGRPVDVADPRDPAQVEQARAQTARDQQLADQLHRENAAREAAHRKALLAEAKQAQKMAAAQRRAARARERARKDAQQLATRKAVSPKALP